MGEVREATEASLKAASHLTAMDAGARRVLLSLASTIDAVEDGASAADEDGKPRSLDNVTIPTYLKFCESLGLTPAGRLRLGDQKKEGPGGKLASLRSVHGGKSA